MRRFKQSAKHIGRESHKFSIELRALEVSGLPQSVITSSAEGTVFVMLQRGVKVARSQPASAMDGRARWLGDTGAASLVATLYKSQDKAGMGKAFSSKPYRLAIVIPAPPPLAAEGRAPGRKLPTLPPMPGRKAAPTELACMDLDLAPFAPPTEPMAERDVTLEVPLKSGGGNATLVIRVTAIAMDGGSGGGDEDDDDMSDTLSVSSRLAPLPFERHAAAGGVPSVAEGAPAPAPDGSGAGQAPSGLETPQRSAAAAERNALVANLSEVREGLTAELQRRRTKREGSVAGDSPGVSRAGTSVLGGPSSQSGAVVQASTMTELLRLRDERVTLAGEVDDLRASLAAANERTAAAEVDAVAAREAAQAANARAERATRDLEGQAAGAREIKSRMARAAEAAEEARGEAEEARASLAAEAARRAAAEEALAQAREETARARAEAVSTGEAAASDWQQRAEAGEATCEALRNELAALRRDWDESLSRVTSSTQLKVDRLTSAKAALEAREAQLLADQAALQEALTGEQERAEDALRALAYTREALAAEKAARASAEDEVGTLAKAKSDAALSIEAMRAQLASAQAQADELAIAEQAGRAATSRDGSASSPLPPTPGGALAVPTPSHLNRSHTAEPPGDLAVGSDAGDSEYDERDDQIFELTIELVDAKMRLAQSEFERDEAKLAARRLHSQFEMAAEGSEAAGMELGVAITQLEVKNMQLKAECERARARVRELEGQQRLS